MAFDFVSPGAAATAALRQVMQQNEERRRQQLLDSITQSREARLDEATQAQTANTQANTESLIAQRQANAKIAADEAAAKDEERFAKTHRIGDQIDPTEAAKHPGFVQPKKRPKPVVGAAPGYEADAAPPEMEDAPGEFEFTGTPQQRQAEDTKKAVRGIIEGNPEVAAHPGIKTALQVAEATGDYSGIYGALAQMTKASDSSKLGSFEDYVMRTYGRNPTSEQLLKARREYGQADDASKGGGGGNPYYMPVQTADGIQVFDARTGKVTSRLGDLKLGESAAKDIANGKTVLTLLDGIMGQMTPDKIGPVVGRYKSVQDAITGGDPQFSQLAAQIATLQNTVINLRTGAAMSEKEAARIMAELPDENLPPATFLARLNNAKNYYQTWLNNRETVARGNGNGGGGQHPAAPPAPTGDGWTVVNGVRIRKKQ